MPLVQDLRWRATHRSDISRASGLRPHVALHCCTAGLLHCWPAALLACCTAGLLHCWPAALLAACCTAGLLHCWPAAMLQCTQCCCAAALLHSRHVPCPASACNSAQSVTILPCMHIAARAIASARHLMHHARVWWACPRAIGRPRSARE
jgi:hypothetical protein